MIPPCFKVINLHWHVSFQLNDCEAVCNLCNDHVLFSFFILHCLPFPSILPKVSKLSWYKRVKLQLFLGLLRWKARQQQTMAWSSGPTAWWPSSSPPSSATTLAPSESSSPSSWASSVAELVASSQASLSSLSLAALSSSWVLSSGDTIVACNFYLIETR